MLAVQPAGRTSEGNQQGHRLVQAWSCNGVPIAGRKAAPKMCLFLSQQEGSWKEKRDDASHRALKANVCSADPSTPPQAPTPANAKLGWSLGISRSENRSCTRSTELSLVFICGLEFSSFLKGQEMLMFFTLVKVVFFFFLIDNRTIL